MYKIDDDFSIFRKLGLKSGSIIAYRSYGRETFIKSKLVFNEGRYVLIFLEGIFHGHNGDWHDGEIVLGTEIKNNCWYPEIGTFFYPLDKSAMRNY